MCVDDEGCLWVAMWGGWEVRRYAPDGRQLGSVPMPVSEPTCCCFVDDVLVITSAALGLSEDDLAAQPHAGAVFAIRPGCLRARRDTRGSTQTRTPPRKVER